jgi:hypothetical protein
LGDKHPVKNTILFRKFRGQNDGHSRSTKPPTDNNPRKNEKDTFKTAAQLNLNLKKFRN